MIAIKNAELLIKPGQIISNGALLIKDGKIAAAGTEADLPISGAERTIDAMGNLVTPGLIDVHTHVGIHEEGLGWEGADFNETSAAVTPHVRALDGIYPFDRGFEDAARSGVTTVQVLPGSANAIGGLMCILKVKPGRVVEEMLIRHPSGLKMALGENPKRLHGKQGRAPVTRMGTAALIREALTKAKNYLKRKEKGEAETDLRMEALALVLKRDIPVRIHAHRADDIMTALRIAGEFNIKMTIEHTTEGNLIAPHLAKHKVMVCIGPTLSSRSKVELREINWETYRVLEEAGVPFSLTTDHPVLPIDHLITSAALAVRHGLPEEAAWNAVTLQAAKHLELEKRIGSLEAGKDADLVIWSDSPLTRHAKVRLTMVEGTVVYESSAMQNG